MKIFIYGMRLLVGISLLVAVYRYVTYPPLMGTDDAKRVTLEAMCQSVPYIVIGHLNTRGDECSDSEGGGDYCNADLEITHTLKGDITGPQSLCYGVEDDPHYLVESGPILGVDYILFLWENGGEVEVRHLLPVSQKTVAKLQKIIATQSKPSPLGHDDTLHWGQKKLDWETICQEYDNIVLAHLNTQGNLTMDLGCGPRRSNAELEITKCLKGDLFGKLPVSYQTILVPSHKKDPPQIGITYLFFIHGAPSYGYGIGQILPSSEDNIAAVELWLSRLPEKQPR